VSAPVRVARTSALALPRLGDERAALLKAIQDAIARGGWVLCLGHVQPDGDALGSALALAFAIRQAGGQALVSFDPGPLPFGLPPSLNFLPGANLLADPRRVLADESSPAAVVTFDTGSAERLGCFTPFVADRAQDSPVLVIDHHARGDAFGAIRLIDGSAAATAELIAGLIDELGVPFDADIATCLYAGLASDTGSFR
jgi:bifunctional oligoribonuclease and PAP phosphatase NrnA